MIEVQAKPFVGHKEVVYADRNFVRGDYSDFTVGVALSLLVIEVLSNITDNAVPLPSFDANCEDSWRITTNMPVLEEKNIFLIKIILGCLVFVVCGKDYHL